jgi:hypothetical protein
VYVYITRKYIIYNFQLLLLLARPLRHGARIVELEKMANFENPDLNISSSVEKIVVSKFSTYSKTANEV